MIDHLCSIFLAILGLGVLVFIHEFGHYWMARREGMKVEAFSIGFGPALFSWMRNGVRWQLSLLPFGGYVKIAGMQKEGGREPFEIEGGFFNKSPMQRIRVALMGPLVNIAFSLVIFSLLWFVGGREKRFSDSTHRIGWVDPQSQLYQRGVRPGDLIEVYNGRPFEGFRDVLMASILKGKEHRIQGIKVNALTGAKKNFDYTLSPNEEGMVLAPAAYCIFKEAVPASPLLTSGIRPNDRILWADGEVIFSQQQLSTLINASTAMLTIKRDGELLQIKVPRTHLNDLKMTAVQKAEFDDWQHEAELKGRLDDLYFIPYLLSPLGQIEVRLPFLDPEYQSNHEWVRLEEGDQVVAVDGEDVETSYDLLQKLQERRVLMIVQRDSALLHADEWVQADHAFEERIDLKDLQILLNGIGKGAVQSGRLHLLSPIAPKPFGSFFASQEAKRAIDAIQNKQKRQEALKLWEKEQNRLMLGALFHDRMLHYNPGPLAQCSEVVGEMGRVLKGLVTGTMHPKHLAGPVGIIHIVQNSWSHGGGKEGLFWLGFISLNLGLVNLLPIPVLDGGHILLSLYEGVTRRRLSSKTMERLMIPFIGLLIAFFIYITYQDLVRVFTWIF